MRKIMLLVLASSSIMTTNALAFTNPSKLYVRCYDQYGPIYEATVDYVRVENGITFGYLKSSSSKEVNEATDKKVLESKYSCRVFPKSN